MAQNQVGAEEGAMSEEDERGLREWENSVETLKLSYGDLGRLGDFLEENFGAAGRWYSDWAMTLHGAGLRRYDDD